MSLFFALLAAGFKPILSGGDGGTVQQLDAVSPYNSNVAIRFNTDGTIETGKSKDGAAITWSSAGDWITPTSEASGDYDVRFTNLNVTSGSGDWTSEAAADDTFIDLGTQRTWTNNRTTAQTSTFSCDFEVRDGGGAATTGSASYTFSISNTA